MISDDENRRAFQEGTLDGLEQSDPRLSSGGSHNISNLSRSIQGYIDITDIHSYKQLKIGTFTSFATQPSR